MRVLSFLCLFFGACSHAPKYPVKPKITVSIEEQKLRVEDQLTKKVVFEAPVETSRKGVGYRKHSNRTPLGNYHVIKEPRHRFGPALRLSGYQGYSRGILLHRDFKNGNGTSGCICPINEGYMNRLFDIVHNGTPIEIEL